MSNIDDAQNVAIYNGKGVALPTAVAPKTGDSIVESVTSGTAFQISAVRDAYVYVNIKTAAALQIDLGPTSAVAIPVSVSQTSALGVVTLFVPTGWYLKLTGTNTNYAVTAILK